MEMSGINPSVQMNRYFNAEERLGLEETIAGLNSDLTANNKRVAKTEMGKDDFLLILETVYCANGAVFDVGADDEYGKRIYTFV